MNHAFSDKALRSCEPFIHSNIDRWIELLDQEIGEKKWSPSLNMARWADHLIFDTLGELCFGKSFGMKEHDSELRHIPTLMTDFMSTIHPVRSKTPKMNLLLMLDVRLPTPLLLLSGHGSSPEV